VSSVPSPCISVCRMEAASGLCEGCLRTLDEIAAWGSIDDRARRVIWKQLHQRRALRQPAAATAGTLGALGDSSGDGS
jgi:uncharacterized protein